MSSLLMTLFSKESDAERAGRPPGVMSVQGLGRVSSDPNTRPLPPALLTFDHGFQQSCSHCPGGVGHDGYKFVAALLRANENVLLGGASTSMACIPQP